MTPEPKRRGRPPVPPEARASARIEARVSPALADKFRALGGTSWLVRALKAARVRG